MWLRRTSDLLCFISFLRLILSMSSCFGLAVLDVNLTCRVVLSLATVRRLVIFFTLFWLLLLLMRIAGAFLLLLSF